MQSDQLASQIFPEDAPILPITHIMSRPCAWEGGCQTLINVISTAEIEQHLEAHHSNDPSGYICKWVEGTEKCYRTWPSQKALAGHIARTHLRLR
ncbi:hypothetical protein BKA93DRAFT_193936 [Sparassis latifolia]